MMPQAAGSSCVPLCVVIDHREQHLVARVLGDLRLREPLGVQRGERVVHVADRKVAGPLRERELVAYLHHELGDLIAKVVSRARAAANGRVRVRAEWRSTPHQLETGGRPGMRVRSGLRARCCKPGLRSQPEPEPALTPLVVRR
mgnify:CR=1 FL=1